MKSMRVWNIPHWLHSNYLLPQKLQNTKQRRYWPFNSDRSNNAWCIVPYRLVNISAHKYIPRNRILLLIKCLTQIKFTLILT